ncbi:acetyl esterase, partial [Fusarium albosuccineum]
MRRFFFLLAAATSAVAISQCPLQNMTNLVVFGDSLTDEARILYFMSHQGEAPPVGTTFPPNNQTLTGGYNWGRLVARKTGVQYYNYAVGGATCSVDVATRYFEGFNWSVPTVLEYQVPAFQMDSTLDTLYPDREPDNTVYALWIGANDLGYNAFLTDSMTPGATLTKLTECIWDSFDGIYETGGRHFILFNMMPLKHAPLYAPTEFGGPANSQYWPDKSKYNTTQYNSKLYQYTTSVNTMLEQGGIFECVIKKRWPGASLTIFDVHSLLTDVLENADDYLTSPANTTGVYHSCPAVVESPEDCVDSKQPLSSFFWYDDLHPSEQVANIIADTFIDVPPKMMDQAMLTGLSQVTLQNINLPVKHSQIEIPSFSNGVADHPGPLAWLAQAQTHAAAINLL